MRFEVWLAIAGTTQLQLRSNKQGASLPERVDGVGMGVVVVGIGVGGFSLCMKGRAKQ